MVSVASSIVRQGPSASHTDVHSLVSRMEQSRAEKRQVPTSQSPSPGVHGAQRRAWWKPRTPKRIFPETCHLPSKHFHSKVFQLGENPLSTQSFHISTFQSHYCWQLNFLRNSTTFICQRKGILSDTLTTFSSQAAGICQNVLYLINMYHAGSHILCWEKVSMLQLISLICIQDYT